jgi:translocation and assembly module TamB
MQRKKILAGSLIAIMLLIIVGGIGGYFYLRSESFQRFAIGKIVEQTNLATGGKTEIGALDFDLSTLTAHLRNITIRGTESPNDPPLLHADELTVSFKIISAFHRQFSLSELTIAHPVIHLQVSRQGNNNIPTAPPSRSTSNTSVFDLAVGHVQISNGEVDYNDRKTPLEANLYNLGTDIRFAWPKRYDGHLSYENGNVRYAQYEPLPHNLSLAFTATPESFELQSATLKIGSSTANLRASLSDYNNPVADGDYRLQIHTQDFAAMSPSVSPSGDVRLAGKLHYQTSPDKPLLQNLSVNGQIASDALRARASGRRVDLQELQATYQLAEGNLRVSDFKVDSLGGRITASATINHLDTTPEANIQTDLRNISLKMLQQAMRQQAIPGATLSGTINGKADAAWKGSIDNVHAHSDLTVRALATSKSSRAANDVPVDATIHASYDGSHQSIALRETTLRIPSASLSATGVISDRSNLQLQLAANDLHQLASLAASFTPKQTAPAISGSATLNATIRGSMKKPAISAQLNAQNLQFEGSEWKSASVQAQANPSSISVQNG